MLSRLPRGMPTLADMLADIGHPTTKQLGKAMGVTRQTASRWIRAGEAPRPVMLALFWLTRWGMSQADCEAHNTAVLHVAMAKSLQHRNAELQAQLDRLSRISDVGSANDPLPDVQRHVPASQVNAAPDVPQAEPEPAPKANRKKTASQVRAERAAQRLEERAGRPPTPFDFLRTG